MNMKMKTLSLAVLGLAGFAFAGSAMAACTSANLSAWSATQQNAGTVTVTAGGLNGSECRIDTILTGNLGSAGAYVRDDTPANEARYRAQFLVNVDSLAGITSSQSVRILSATTEAPFQSIPDLVVVTAFGNATGTTKVLGFSVVDADSTGNFYRKSTSVPLTGLSGAIRVEIDYTKSATGSLKVWVNNTTETPTTTTISANTNAWGGVDAAVLGLSGASPNFRASHLNKIIQFDQFDSRRQTFIGG